MNVRTNIMMIESGQQDDKAMGHWIIRITGTIFVLLYSENCFLKVKISVHEVL